MFTAVDGDPSDIYTVRLDGTDLRRLTFSAAFHDHHPVFSPGGHRLLWLRDAHRCCESHLWVMRSDGTHKHRLAGGDNQSLTGADWSPGGRMIAYFEAIGGRLTIIRTDGTLVRHLPRLILGGLVWSPNGRWIAYTTFRNTTGSQVLAVTADGTQPRQFPNFWGGHFFLLSGIGWQPDPSRPGHRPAGQVSIRGRLMSVRTAGTRSPVALLRLESLSNTWRCCIDGSTIEGEGRQHGSDVSGTRWRRVGFYASRAARKESQGHDLTCR